MQNLVAKALANYDMGLHGDIIDPPTRSLASRKPLRVDMEPVDIKGSGRNTGRRLWW